MNIADKCFIIEAFVRDHALGNTDFADISEFLRVNDLGVPLALSVRYKLCTLLPDGEKEINITWNSLCGLLEVDPDGDYETLDDLFASMMEEDDD